MGSELAQKRRLKRRHMELTDDGIRVTESSFTAGMRYIVPYDVLFGDRVEMRVVAKDALWVALGALGCALFGLISYFDGKNDMPWVFAPICALVSIPFFLYFWLSRADLIWFKDGISSFWVVRDQPSAAAVDAFLDDARARARERLRARLLPLIHTKDEYADRDHAMFLRDKGLISEAEYVEYVHENRIRPKDHQFN